MTSAARSFDRLLALPAQPAEVPWPTERWTTGALEPTGALGALLDQAFAEDAAFGPTMAVVIVRGGRLVFSRYAGRLEFFDRPSEPVGPLTALPSWSMAKSVLHAVVGMLVAEGRIDLEGPAAVPEWASDGDPRHQITTEQLLEMRDGLDFAEEYEPGGHSDVIDMLFGEGRHDVAGFAARKPLAAAPGRRFSYSSGTTNVVSGIVARLLGPGEPYRRFLHHRLFEPLGMASATAGFDDAGTWVASSSLEATAEDYARFGLLYLRGGVWEGRALLPPGWVDHGRRARSVDPSDGNLHGAHWWVEDDTLGTFRAAGYEGQAIVVIPALDTVVVRLGKTPLEHVEAWARWRRAVVPALAATG